MGWIVSTPDTLARINASTHQRNAAINQPSAPAACCCCRAIHSATAARLQRGLRELTKNGFGNRPARTWFSIDRGQHRNAAASSFFVNTKSLASSSFRRNIFASSDFLRHQTQPPANLAGQFQFKASFCVRKGSSSPAGEGSGNDPAGSPEGQFFRPKISAGFFPDSSPDSSSPTDFRAIAGGATSRFGDSQTTSAAPAAPDSTANA